MKDTSKSNPTASPIIAVSVTEQPSIPPAPAWLDQHAKTEYNRARDVIHLAGPAAINFIDPAILARYAQLFSDVRRLALAVRVEGEVVTGSDGVPRLSENCLALDRAHKELFMACDALGFNPAARARINGSE